MTAAKDVVGIHTAGRRPLPLFLRSSIKRIVTERSPAPGSAAGEAKKLQRRTVMRKNILVIFLQHTKFYVILQNLQLPKKRILTSAGPPEVGKFNFSGSWLVFARTRGGPIVREPSMYANLSALRLIK